MQPLGFQPSVHSSASQKREQQKQYETPKSYVMNQHTQLATQVNREGL